jgi:hypothetical protein
MIVILKRKDGRYCYKEWVWVLIRSKSGIS